MARLQAVYYRDQDGSEPVREFIAGLSGAEQAALKNQIGRLNSLSDRVPHLAFPHSSQIEGELRELRCHFGRALYRVLYRRSDRLLVLLHGFRKQTGRIPESDIATARHRWRDYQTRIDALSRTGPRPIGRDAP